jgi:hypothetical protein
VDVWLLVLGTLGLLSVIAWTVGTLPREQPTRLDRRPTPRPAAPRPAELANLEREIELSAQTAFDAHYRLRPSLRQIAAGELAFAALELRAAGTADRELVARRTAVVAVLAFGGIVFGAATLAAATIPLKGGVALQAVGVAAAVAVIVLLGRLAVRAR